MSRLARLTKAPVIPVITRRTSAGYVTTLGQPWADYPGESVEADTLRMNQQIEAHILDGDLCHQAQYFWSHKRFKTRPPGEKSLY
jgi:KDO2-lipid IV(A) lauroyltransferase